MRIRIRFFAILRERAGVGEMTLDLPDDATVAAAREALAKQFSTLNPLLERVAFAVNQEYVLLTKRLNDGDELAVIPPVSGG